MTADRKIRDQSILITGVPGCGKSATCDELRKRGYKADDIENIEGLFQMVDKATGKNFGNYIENDLESTKKHDWICDKHKLRELLRQNPRGTTFIAAPALISMTCSRYFRKSFY